MTLQQTGKLFIIALALASQSAWSDLVATVDRTIITDLDTVTLTIRASNESSGIELDLTGIEKDFNIVSNSTRQNSSMSIINGRTTSVVYKDHVLTLSPKRLGILLIPAISAGNLSTQPIGIRVQQQTASQRQRMNQYVFFETDVDTNQTYVQAQIIYTVKLFYTEAIGGDFPQPPALEDAVVETIENEKRSEAIVDGRRYYVLEKRYAIFPQRSGIVTIPRERFIGTRGRGGIFSQRQRVNAVSGSHRVVVKTIPDSFSGDNWIPAKALGVNESWAETPPVFRVGEPVNRKLMISAIGLPDSLLPELGEMQVENAKTYADPPVTENRVSPDGITAFQVTTIGIVPTREGEITLPEIRIPWWNTQSDREESAVVPAATYRVLPALGGTVAAPMVTIPITELNKPTVIQQISSRYWQWAAIGFGLLWLISTWQWFALRRQVRALQSAGISRFEAAVFEDPDEARLYKSLKEACTRNRAADTHRQLFLWAKARYPEISSVTQLGDQQPELAAEIAGLESHLYSTNEPGAWRGKTILKQLNQIRRAKEKRGKRSALEAELNPA